MKERLKGDGETETTSQEACVAALQGAWCGPGRPRSWLPLSRPQRSSWIVQAAKPHRFQGPEGSAGSPPVPAASRYRPCVQITELPVLICPGHLQGLPSLLLSLVLLPSPYYTLATLLFFQALEHVKLFPTTISSSITIILSSGRILSV